MHDAKTCDMCAIGFYWLDSKAMPSAHGFAFGKPRCPICGRLATNKDCTCNRQWPSLPDENKALSETWPYRAEDQD